MQYAVETPLFSLQSKNVLLYHRLGCNSSRRFIRYAFRNIGGADANWHVITVFVASNSSRFWWQLCREVVALFVTW
jgi:hypothetical protein